MQSWVRRQSESTTSSRPAKTGDPQETDLRARIRAAVFFHRKKTVLPSTITEQFPTELIGELTRHLLSSFEYDKVQPNYAVHPKKFQVSAESVRPPTCAFPLAFRKVEAVRDLCPQNPVNLYPRICNCRGYFSSAGLGVSLLPSPYL